MATLKGANTTAQWYQDNYPGAVFPRLDKVVLHSTETEGWPGYSGGASAPNVTWNPRTGQLRQHHSNNRSSRALVDPSGTAVRENRDNVFQIEIIAYSDYAIARRVGGLWIGDLTDAHMDQLADILIQLHRELGLPLTSTVKWREGQKTYVSGVRLSGPAYDAYRGILAHMHVSGNVHWDVGGFRWSKLKAAIARRLGGTTPKPEPEPDPKVDPMDFVMYYGSSRGRGICGDLMVAMSRATVDKFIKAGAKRVTLTNAEVEALAAQLRWEGDPEPDAA